MADDKTEHGSHCVDTGEEQQVADCVHLFQGKLLPLYINSEQHTHDIFRRLLHMPLHHIEKIAAYLLSASDPLLHRWGSVESRLPGIELIETLWLES